MTDRFNEHALIASNERDARVRAELENSSLKEENKSLWRRLIASTILGLLSIGISVYRFWPVDRVDYVPVKDCVSALEDVIHDREEAKLGRAACFATMTMRDLDQSMVPVHLANALAEEEELRHRVERERERARKCEGRGIQQ